MTTSSDNFFRVLLVDDNEQFLTTMEGFLSADPQIHMVGKASSGEEALQLAKNAKPHLVLMDIAMPDMHGLEVLGFLRSHRKYRDLPVTVLTTRGDEASRKATIEAGASLYLTKPFKPAQLKQHVLELLGGTS
jgi:two-component system, chemotaxis family, chemotaxis protein CheY